MATYRGAVPRFDRSLSWLLTLVALGVGACAAPGPRPTSTSAAAAASAVVRFSAAGDFDNTADTAKVLEDIAARGDDFTLALGDLSYGRVGTEAQWCDFVTARVGPTYPFQLLSGNHESDGENGLIANFLPCLPDRLTGVVGGYGKQWYVDVPAQDPVVRFVMISPDLDFGAGQWSYRPGTAHYRWTTTAIDGARALSIPWVVVGMHKPCHTVGRYSCDVGRPLLDLLVSKRVDLVLAGHEHAYMRTSALGVGPGCDAVPVNRFDADCVAQTGGDLTKGSGTVFAVVGTGGVGLRDLDLADPEEPYFESYSGANVDPAHGSLDVTVSATELTAVFDPIPGATFTDRFTIAAP